MKKTCLRLAGPTSSRPRREPPPSIERKRETSDVLGAFSKVQRISLLFRTADHPMKVFDLRVSAVTTKQEVDVPANVNQDEAEMTLEECFVNPLFRQSAEFAKSTACFKHKTPKFSLSINRTTFAGNSERKSQTRKQINSPNKCDLRVLTVVTKESVSKLDDQLLGFQSLAMILLALGTDTSGTPGPRGQVRNFMFPALRESGLSFRTSSR